MTAQKVFLIGYMASGKSTLGKELSQKLNCPFVDLDDQVEENMGMRIHEAIEKHGELYFRKQEHNALKKMLESLPESAVVATGGGTPVFYDHMEMLNAHGETVFLDVPLKALTERLEGDLERPLLKNHADKTEFIAKHLFERRPFYSLSKHRLAGAGIHVNDLLELLD
jgi:shikimate kinase